VLFTLPSLRTLVIVHAYLWEGENRRDEATERAWHCRKRTSTIQELTLKRCEIPTAWISKLIKKCRILCSFHLEYFHWHTSTADYLQIYNALKLHQDTLSEFQMLQVNGCKAVSARQADLLQPTSFQQFSSLTHLEVPLFTFCTRTQHVIIDKLLPPSLKALTVDLWSTREGPSDNFFLTLAEFAKHGLPALKTITIKCRIDEYREEGSLPLHFCHLRRLLLRYGVELSYSLGFVSCEFLSSNVPDLRLIAFTNSSSSKNAFDTNDHATIERGWL
jgi:hypothetical protein